MKRSHISSSTDFSDAFGPAERRSQLRLQPPSLVYVELDEGNGGIALNLSENGMAVQAVMGLMDDTLSRVRFQLSESKEWIETSAEVAWANETRKLLGLRFVDMPEHSRNLIRKWLDRENSVNQDMGAPAPFAKEDEANKVAQEAAPSTLSAAEISAPSASVAPNLDVALPNDSESNLDSVWNSASPSERSVPLYIAPHDGSALASERSADDDHVVADVEHKIAKTPEGVSEERMAPAFAYQRKDFQLSAPAEGLTDKWTAAIFFLFLAAASLAAGWAVGRGALTGGVQALRRASTREGAASGATGSRSAASISQPHLSDIEIVNLENDRWTIPLNAPGPPVAAQTRVDGSASPSSSRSKTPFRTWVLSAPLQSKSVPSGAEAAAPPAVTAAVESPQALPLEQPAIPAPPAPKQAVIRRAELIHHVDPLYPPLALLRRVEGVVTMRITVNANGDVRNIRVLSGPSLLVDAAVKAAGQWFYSPTLVDGKPTESDVDISMAFHLP